MNKILNLIVLLFLTATSFAQKGPQIKFKAENNTINYGTVKKGEDSGIRIIEFTNTGDQPLIITKVESTCGCTVPSFSTQPIMPSKTGQIEVKYNMSVGRISRTLTVNTNAINAENGKVFLRIKGEVLNP